jgi:Ca2+-binding RTX toxin-like protein
VKRLVFVAAIAASIALGGAAVADNGPDVIVGTSGDDKLVGGKGPDILIGKAGDDRLWGGRGPDEFRCGPGRDVVHQEFDTGADIVRKSCEVVRT